MKCPAVPKYLLMIPALDGDMYVSLVALFFNNVTADLTNSMQKDALT